MTINHIDQLAQWWDEAEEGVIEKGDTVINRSDGETTVYVATERARRHHANARILARAPKPKPAWHDAKAVTAITKKHPNFRDVWVADNGEWRNVDGEFINVDDLRDVTPLVEAKVTDEMVKRAMAFWDLDYTFDTHDEDIQWARDFIAAALGLETE